VWANRLKESVAMISIGDGVLALIAPRNHTMLWLLGPKKVRKLSAWFVENPLYIRLGGIVETGLGLWLALRQYKEAAPIQPWYQRWLAQYRLLPSWLAPLVLLAVVLTAVVFMRTRGKRPSEEEYAPEELTVEEAAAEDGSSKEMRSIIRESVRRSGRQP
jgi:hypothetical protein